jgi:hypothetical protein
MNVLKRKGHRAVQSLSVQVPVAVDFCKHGTETPNYI